MYIETIGILYHDVGIVMRIPSHNINFKGAMEVCKFVLLSFNHRKGSKVPFHSCPKPHQVHFFKQGLGVNV
jgi:hypothetical protein